MSILSKVWCFEIFLTAHSQTLYSPRPKIAWGKMLKQTKKDDLTLLKQQVKDAELKAAIAVNRELIRLYWNIGKAILNHTSWVKTLAADLKIAFPNMKVFSQRNLLFMRQFAEAYPDLEMSQPILQLPWGHNVVLLIKITDYTQRIWYAEKAIEYGWSRSALEDWIKSEVFFREGKAVPNTASLVNPQSKLAQEILEDPYIFDLLNLTPELESSFRHHLQKTWAKVTSLAHLQVGRNGRLR